MKNFDKSIRLFLEKDNKGNNFGITLKQYQYFFPRATQETLEQLTLGQAEKFYYDAFWRPCGCDRLPIQIAYHIFRFASEEGVYHALRLAQSIADIKPTGSLTENTISKINNMDIGVFTNKYMKRQIDYYIKLFVDRDDELLSLKPRIIRTLETDYQAWSLVNGGRRI